MSRNGSKIATAIGERDKLGIYSIFPKALLNQLSHINNISYKEKVLIPKDQEVCNIFDEMNDSLKKIWINNYGLNECFEIFKIYREFEPILFKGLHYRDHFIHQYLVFMTGLPMISQSCGNIKSNISKIDGITKDLVDVEKSWLLASTFHDISYPVQNFDDWLKSFFVNFLNIKMNPIYINMSPILLERCYLPNLYLLGHFSYQVQKKWNPVLEKEYLDRLWMEKFLKRNHGVFSSLILLDKCEIAHGPGTEKYSHSVFFSQVLPSALAIALHDSDVWEDRVISQIIYEKDPISFLLAYCDTVQEWGRPLIPYNIQQSPYWPLMTKYDLNDQKISITLTYDIVEEVRLRDGSISTNFVEKGKEISNLFNKLKSSTVKFEIILESTDADYDYKPFIKSSLDD